MVVTEVLHPLLTNFDSSKDVVQLPDAVYQQLLDVAKSRLGHADLTQTYQFLNEAHRLNPNLNVVTIEHTLMAQVVAQALNPDDDCVGVAALWHDIGRAFSHRAGRNSHVANLLLRQIGADPKVVACLPKHSVLLPSEAEAFVLRVKPVLSGGVLEDSVHTIDGVAQLVNALDTAIVNNIGLDELQRRAKDYRTWELQRLAYLAINKIGEVHRFTDDPRVAMVQYSDLAGRIVRDKSTGRGILKPLNDYSNAQFHANHHELPPPEEIKGMWPSAYTWQAASVLFAAAYARRDGKVLDWVHKELAPRSVIERKVLDYFKQHGIAVTPDGFITDSAVLVIKKLSEGLIVV